jgi:antirestriction protein ArdC/phage/plasmid primase-like uncharacterized protein
MSEDSKKKMTATQAEIAEKIIAALENGTAPWIKPWKANEALESSPFNPVTGTRYTGANTINLMIESTLNFGGDPRWFTFKNAISKGYVPAKGSKAAKVIAWIKNDPKDALDEEGKPILNPDGTPKTLRQRPGMRVYSVFNAQQLVDIKTNEPMPPLAPAEIIRPAWEPIEIGEQILSNSGAVIVHDQANRAFYAPSIDEIHLPPKASFPEVDGYYGTATHELGHWTGHKSRLNRDLGGGMGSNSYAVEELRAEISSWMVAKETGLPHDPSRHTAYVKSWGEQLRKDPNLLYTVMGDAEKITQFVLKFAPDLKKEKEQAQGEIQEHPNAPSIVAVPLSSLAPLSAEAGRFLEFCGDKENKNLAGLFSPVAENLSFYRYKFDDGAPSSFHGRDRKFFLTIEGKGDTEPLGIFYSGLDDDGNQSFEGYVIKDRDSGLIYPIPLYRAVAEDLSQADFAKTASMALEKAAQEYSKNVGADYGQRPRLDDLLPELAGDSFDIAKSLIYAVPNKTRSATFQLDRHEPPEKAGTRLDIYKGEAPLEGFVYHSVRSHGLEDSGPYLNPAATELLYNASQDKILVLSHENDQLKREGSKRILASGNREEISAVLGAVVGNLEEISKVEWDGLDLSGAESLENGNSISEDEGNELEDRPTIDEPDLEYLSPIAERVAERLAAISGKDAEVGEESISLISSDISDLPASDFVLESFSEVNPNDNDAGLPAQVKTEGIFAPQYFRLGVTDGDTGKERSLFLAKNQNSGRFYALPDGDISQASLSERINAAFRELDAAHFRRFGCQFGDAPAFADILPKIDGPRADFAKALFDKNPGRWGGGQTYHPVSGPNDLLHISTHRYHLDDYKALNIAGVSDIYGPEYLTLLKGPDDSIYAFRYCREFEFDTPGVDTMLPHPRQDEAVQAINNALDGLASVKWNGLEVAPSPVIEPSPVQEPDPAQGAESGQENGQGDTPEPSDPGGDTSGPSDPGPDDPAIPEAPLPPPQWPEVQSKFIPLAGIGEALVRGMIDERMKAISDSLHLPLPISRFAKYEPVGYDGKAAFNTSGDRTIDLYDKIDSLTRAFPDSYDASWVTGLYSIKFAYSDGERVAGNLGDNCVELDIATALDGRLYVVGADEQPGHVFKDPDARQVESAFFATEESYAYQRDLAEKAANFLPLFKNSVDREYYEGRIESLEAYQSVGQLDDAGKEELEEARAALAKLSSASDTLDGPDGPDGGPGNPGGSAPDSPEGAVAAENSPRQASDLVPMAYIQSKGLEPLVPYTKAVFDLIIAEQEVNKFDLLSSLGEAELYQENFLADNIAVKSDMLNFSDLRIPGDSRTIFGAIRVLAGEDGNAYPVYLSPPTVSDNLAPFNPNNPDIRLIDYSENSVPINLRLYANFFLDLQRSRIEAKYGMTVEERLAQVEAQKAASAMSQGEAGLDAPSDAQAPQPGQESPVQYMNPVQARLAAIGGRGEAMLRELIDAARADRKSQEDRSENFAIGSSAYAPGEYNGEITVAPGYPALPEPVFGPGADSSWIDSVERISVARRSGGSFGPAVHMDVAIAEDGGLYPLSYSSDSAAAVEEGRNKYYTLTDRSEDLQIQAEIASLANNFLAGYDQDRVNDLRKERLAASIENTEKGGKLTDSALSGTFVRPSSGASAPALSEEILGQVEHPVASLLTSLGHRPIDPSFKTVYDLMKVTKELDGLSLPSEVGQAEWGQETVQLVLGRASSVIQAESLNFLDLKREAYGDAVEFAGNLNIVQADDGNVYPCLLSSFKTPIDLPLPDPRDPGKIFVDEPRITDPALIAGYANDYFAQLKASIEAKYGMTVEDRLALGQSLIEARKADLASNASQANSADAPVSEGLDDSLASAPSMPLSPAPVPWVINYDIESFSLNATDKAVFDLIKAESELNGLDLVSELGQAEIFENTRDIYVSKSLNRNLNLKSFSVPCDSFNFLDLRVPEFVDPTRVCGSLTFVRDEVGNVLPFELNGFNESKSKMGVSVKDLDDPNIHKISSSESLIPSAELASYASSFLQQQRARIEAKYGVSVEERLAQVEAKKTALAFGEKPLSAWARSLVEFAQLDPKSFYSTENLKYGYLYDIDKSTQDARLKDLCAAVERHHGIPIEELVAMARTKKDIETKIGKAQAAEDPKILSNSPVAPKTEEAVSPASPGAEGSISGAQAKIDKAMILDVPYSDNAKVKAMGARFDLAEKHWYVPAGVDKEPFEYWKKREPGQPAPPKYPNRKYINVPFSEKEEASALGAKWDRPAKSWYIPETADPEKLKKWDRLPAAPSPVVPPAQEFKGLLESKGLILDSAPIMDGQLHRVPVQGGKPGSKDGAYLGHENGYPNGFYQNYRNDDKGNWIYSAHKLNPEELKTLKSEIAQNKTVRTEEREAVHAKAMRRAAERLAAQYKLKPAKASAEVHPYLHKKGIAACGGIYLESHGEKKNLLVPGYSISPNGLPPVLRTIQTITEDGQKFFMKDCPKNGACFVVQNDDPAKRLDGLYAAFEKKGEAPDKKPAVFIAEGFATATSLHMATGHPAVCAFDSGNIAAVAESVAKAYPKAEIIICADNDHSREVNVGVKKAMEAAKKIDAKVIVPRFTDAQIKNGLTDYNDLMVSIGQKALAKEIKAQIAEISASRELEGKPVGIQESAKIEAPKEKPMPILPPEPPAPPRPSMGR